MVHCVIRDRPDTIRCIVSNLVGDDDPSDSLVDETEPIQPLQQQEAEDYSDPAWEPDPMDAGPGRLLPISMPLFSPIANIIEFRTNKPGDIISTLVSIYDSRDLFIKELQVLLAQRLLAAKDGMDRVEKEVCRPQITPSFSIIAACLLGSQFWSLIRFSEKEYRNSQDSIWRICPASM